MKYEWFVWWNIMWGRVAGGEGVVMRSQTSERLRDCVSRTQETRGNVHVVLFSINSFVSSHPELNRRYKGQVRRICQTIIVSTNMLRISTFSFSCIRHLPDLPALTVIHTLHGFDMVLHEHIILCNPPFIP